MKLEILRSDAISCRRESVDRKRYATEELDAVWLRPDTTKVSDSKQHPAADSGAESAADCTRRWANIAAGLPNNFF